MHLKRLVITILLSVGSAGAFADAGDLGRSSRDAVRAFHVQNIYLERGQQQQLQPPPSDRRENRSYPGQDSSGYGGQPDTQSSTQSAENARRQGRMSPEERKALRRQIDEVGHDIYAPKR